jgi:hypothetical protein
MVAISGKVTASTVSAALTTIVFADVAPHVFHGTVPADLVGLAGAAITAGVTFVAGYMARHGLADALPQVVKDEAVKVLADVLPAVPAAEPVAAPQAVAVAVPTV